MVARLLGFDRFAELPVRIERRFGSTISVRAVAGILADTFAIWWRLRVTHQYGSQGLPENAALRGLLETHPSPGPSADLKARSSEHGLDLPRT